MSTHFKPPVVLWLPAIGGAVLLLGVAAPGFLKAAVAIAIVLCFASVAALRTAWLNSSSTWRSDHARVANLEQRLDEQRRAVDQLADSLEVAIFICDEKSLVLYANQYARTLFRFEQPLRRPVIAVTLSYDVEKLLASALKASERKEAIVNFSYPEERVTHCVAWPEPGSYRLFLAVYDITHVRHLERVRQDFVANVSHELRTPLATIRAMAETLQDSEQELMELSGRYLPKIVSEVDRLSALTSDLLVLSASEATPVRMQSCDAGEVISQTVQQLEPKAKAKGLSLVYQGTQGLRAGMNPAQLTQVAINLIDNSINYTNEGSVEVTLTGTEDDLEFRVTDSGIGIAQQHQPRIFERFYRVDKARSRTTGGTGLGLSIVKHIVEANGGTVAVESDLGKGSTFTVKLPLVEETPDSEAANGSSLT